MLLHNNLALNKLCISSIIERTDWPNFELVLVDNASTDGSRDFAREIAGKHDNVKLVLNDRNGRVSAKANNLGRGRVSHGFTNTSCCSTTTRSSRAAGLRASSDIFAAIRSDRHGGPPVTPIPIGNEAKIDVPYTAIEEIEPFAASYCPQREGANFDIKVLALFCTAMRRAVFDQVGRLDERFEVGMFEDDDLAMRVKQAGHRIVCAEDVFIHHFHGSTFKMLGADVHRRTFEENRRKYEEKWGDWQPHKYRRAG